MLKSGNQSLITKRYSKTPTEEQKGFKKKMYPERKEKGKEKQKEKETLNKLQKGVRSWYQDS